MLNRKKLRRLDGWLLALHYWLEGRA